MWSLPYFFLWDTLVKCYLCFEVDNLLLWVVKGCLDTFILDNITLVLGNVIQIQFMEVGITYVLPCLDLITFLVCMLQWGTFIFEYLF